MLFCAVPTSRPLISRKGQALLYCWRSCKVTNLLKQCWASTPKIQFQCVYMIFTKRLALSKSSKNVTAHRFPISALFYLQSLYQAVRQGRGNWADIKDENTCLNCDEPTSPIAQIEFLRELEPLSDVCTQLTWLTHQAKITFYSTNVLRFSWHDSSSAIHIFLQS